MMKVLEVGKFYYPYRGGMETCLYDLCSELKRSVELSVLVSNDRFGTVAEEVEGVPVVRVSRWGELFSTSVCPTFPLWLRRFEADVIEMHHPNPLSGISYMIASPPGRLVIRYHSDIVRQRVGARLYAPFFSALFDRASRIIVTSPDYLRSSAALRRYEGKCRVIPIGIDLGGLRRTAEVERRVRAIEEMCGGPMVLFVGRLSKYKGVDVLLRAAGKIRGRVFIAGRGEEEGNLKSLSRSLGVEEKVTFLGELDPLDLLAHLHACDLFVLPSVSRNEAFGIVQLEAFACSKPVVSTALDTGVRFVNRDGETGILVPPGDAPALGDAVNRLLSDEGLRRRMGESGRARVEEYFTRERMAAETLDLFREVLEEGSGTRGVGKAPVVK